MVSNAFCLLLCALAFPRVMGASPEPAPPSCYFCDPVSLGPSEYSCKPDSSGIQVDCGEHFTKQLIEKWKIPLLENFNLKCATRSGKHPGQLARFCAPGYLCGYGGVKCCDGDYCNGIKEATNERRAEEFLRELFGM